MTTPRSFATRRSYGGNRRSQFTQEDPLGLAGGLNAYGYANGDPVNFSDPFGLSPRACDPPGSCESMAALVGTVAGAGAGVVITTACATVTLGLCTLAGPELTLGLSALGTSIGLAIGSKLESSRSANDIPLVGGPPNTTVTKPGQAVRYGPDGNATTRTCARAGHGCDGAHTHEYVTGPNGKLNQKGQPRPATEDEKKETPPPNDSH
ncbi:MAG TPA: RHS repeat-associated core domain-containing protein [Gemmatimonadaceae bacterium]|nr:RHS repeat-associated core domain-containing protein [Gemmatimonadaceae bacterium]